MEPTSTSIDTPSGSKLPSLASVRIDAAEGQFGQSFWFFNFFLTPGHDKPAKKMREYPENDGNIVIVHPNAPNVDANILPMHLRLAIIFSNRLANLVRFSYLAQEQDVPGDVVDASIWALSLFIQIFEECPESVLRVQNHVLPDQDYQESRYVMLLNARQKMAWRLLYAGRAQEAIPYAKAMVDEELTQGGQIWLHHPMPFMIYGETLVLSRADDEEAAKTLRRALLGIESVNYPRHVNGISHLIRTRVFLSRALRNIGLDEEAIAHEIWLATWFRKNPRLMPENEMKYLLLPAGPILDVLGGEKWLETRKQTTKAEERIVKACRTCGARDPLATLSRCNNCKYTYYCSRACQKANWSHHKVECRERAETRKKIELRSLTDPEGARRAADWTSYCNSNHYQVEYLPTATSLKHKFRVVACGVFRIKDVLPDLEAIMGLDLGEGQEYVESGTNTAALREIPYNPDWRKGFNVGAPPKPMVLPSGAKDVEHVF
ncbi:hypothetical protein B0H16DRAFT_1459263 [Mycena metata]|uniref:MYND-type domain-containing protein n=1 Tax=Mycena metata TaxID=1033252 RepID=A0AAD7J162_9AGAR|nr:hypothetical protein B0H16DRAFT_1459263 [Mycena metata]